LTGPAIRRAAMRHDSAIFTDAKDFLGYKKTVLPIRLHHLEKRG
jgi:hypothetical protein